MKHIFKKVLSFSAILMMFLFVFNAFGKEKVNQVTFKFFGTEASEVYLAGNFNNWSTTATKMTKNGDYFSVTVPISSNVQYKFVADGAWCSDSLNLQMIGENFNAFLQFPVKGLTNIDPTIKKYQSKNFEYYTIGEDKTVKLEKIYTSLTENILNNYHISFKPRKIIYLGLKYENPTYPNAFSVPQAFDNCVIDSGDCASSHEIIHTLVSIKNAAINEGIAQCFQREGNEIMKVQNVNLFAKEYIEKNEKSNLESIITKNIRGNGEAYKLMGSFIYFEMVNSKHSESFNNFLNSLEFKDNLDTIQNKYKTAMESDFVTDVLEWEKWLLTIDKGSDIYVKGYNVLM